MSNPNEPAYPVKSFHNSDTRAGLTKRELIAAMAMQGLCACSIPGDHKTFKNLAREAVEYADELLEALEQK